MKNITATEIKAKIDMAALPRHVVNEIWNRGVITKMEEMLEMDRMREPAWVPTPKRHWRYWFGYRWRRDNAYASPTYAEPDWEYQTNGQRARQHLAVAFGDGDLGSEHHVSQQ